jgi:hypothetical protein
MHKKLCSKDLKVAKTEHVIIQQLINQIERARTNLDLTDETSIIIDQVQTEKSFEFASMNLTKKSDKSVSYCGTMSENFQQLEKAVTSLYARNVLFQARNMSNELISFSVTLRVMTTSSPRARLLLASYDSQSSMIKILRLLLFRIHLCI